MSTDTEEWTMTWSPAASEVLPETGPADPATRWPQAGLTAREERLGDLYAGLAGTARQVLRDGLADEFFFMHKPPGLRIRFHPVAGAAPDLHALLRERLDDWRAGGVITGWRPGVYEPETYLFGGPASMRGVHRVFTADSLALLDHHRLRLAGQSPGPSWAMSLLLLRTLFGALRITGRDDLGVWERVRRVRPIGQAALDDPRFARLTTVLRELWPSPDRLGAKLSPAARESEGEYRRAVAAEGERWARDSFDGGSAGMTAEAVAAYLVIFHWNRAYLPALRQALIAEALRTR